MKYAIVTGGTKGIGKQISLKLLSRDFFVFATYRQDKVSANLCKKEFSQTSSNFSMLNVNLQNNREISNLIKHIVQKTDRIDCFIGNAGTTTKKLFSEITNEEWELDFRINLHSNFFLLRDLDKLFINKGNVIFIGSLLGERPHGISLSYGVSKAALHALALNLVKVYSEREIRVNVIAPGFVNTAWHNTKPAEIKNRIIEKIAMKRFAEANEIADACMFLMENEYVNGTILDINGGYSFEK